MEAVLNQLRLEGHPVRDEDVPRLAGNLPGLERYFPRILR